jgi:phosphinothricin acetyltransferase
MDIRPGDAGDLEAINDVYNHYVRNSPATFDLDEQTMDARREWFDGFGGRYKLFVAYDGDDFLGYVCTKPIFTRRAYDTSAFSSVYLHPDRRGRGIGTALYRVLFGSLTGEDLHRLYAGITLPNEASVALHERFGFVKVAHFSEQGRKFGTYWDVAWLEKQL